jgi:hypothetical protein
MAGVGPLDLAAAVRAVALILDGGQMRVLGLGGRQTYPHESTSAVVTVSVHLDGVHDVDQAADLLGLGEGAIDCNGGLYSRAGDRPPGVYVSLYGRAVHSAASMAGVAS